MEIKVRSMGWRAMEWFAPIFLGAGLTLGIISAFSKLPLLWGFGFTAIYLGLLGKAEKETAKLLRRAVPKGDAYH